LRSGTAAMSILGMAASQPSATKRMRGQRVAWHNSSRRENMSVELRPVFGKHGTAWIFKELRSTR
jgi:hypothetical protein